MTFSHKRSFDLNAQKKAMLDKILREEGAEAILPQRVSRRKDGDRLLLSFAQQRLWFLDQLAPGSPFYNLPVAVRLRGRLELGALSASLNALVARHETLRTSFSTLEGQPVQLIAPPAPLALARLDLQGLSEAERSGLLGRLLAQEARRPFELRRGPLVRALLLALAPSEHVLLLTMHHSISDGWSVEVLFRELGALYAAAKHARDLATSLPPLPIQYADYALWQRRWMRGPVLDAQLGYWKRQLAGAPALLELPTDQPRPAVQTFEGTTASFVLPAGLRAALVALSRRCGVTLFMTLLASWQLLLARYSGQHDILVGTPIAGRTRSELEGLIGFFANTLVMRTNLRGNPSFRELLGRVREVCLQAYAHQDLPFEKLVEELRLERNLCFNPLFQVLFALQDAPAADAKFDDLALQSFPVSSGTAKVDLSLMIVTSEHELTGTLTGNADMFEPATVARMARHFQVLLEAIVADPEQRLAYLPLLTPDEWRQRVAWNETAAPYPSDACIHQLFEAQAARTPDAIAIVFETTNDEDQTMNGTVSSLIVHRSSFIVQMTYGELNRRANQLAEHLRDLGVGPEVLVGLCMDRSPEQIFGLLAILKAGGAYVPLDPAYPAARLAFMMSDAQVPVLLTQERLLERLPELAARVICLDRAWAEPGPAYDRNPASSATPDDLAYVIYTSGSTGKPKGILIQHRGVCNVIPASMRAFGVERGSRVLQMASLSFDASVLELFTGLLSGAAVHLVPPDSVGSPTALARIMHSHAISMMALPPSLLDVLPEETFPALETIVVGGERCPAETVARWAPGRRFVNAYAPTEATIYATAWIGTSSDPHGPPLGQPIDNMQVYVLDANMQPVPPGVPGEIHLGGVGLARGYHNRPELTAERFVPNPFATTDEGRPTTDEAARRVVGGRWSVVGSRLYRTGDLARYRADGTLEFLGRVDNQVKVRGFRIELGEIEALLGQHPGLREVVVMVREDPTPASGYSDKRLIAYIVPHAGHAPTTSDLRTFLRQKLPAYMVPSAFVILQALPLTPNGKVNPHALPAPDSSMFELDRAFVSPRTPTEEALAAIWCELLNLERVGIHDSFFEIGGHSLLATRLILRVRDAFQVDLPLRYLFETSSIAGLAETIDVLRGVGDTSAIDSLSFTDLSEEAVLDPAIVPGTVPATPIVAPAAILLTGATGFLGGYLLSELLQQTQAVIYCLVRAADAEQAMAKLRRHLDSLGLWDAASAGRLIPVVGDLALPQFGLSDEQFRALADAVDAIYHNGALVNFLYPYEALKATNVLGTQEVLRLACLGRVKPVHYVSTLSVFPSFGCAEETVIREQDEPEQTEGLYSGYAQSKWVADKLVRIARSRGLPVCIYRPATVTGDMRTGRSHPDDYTSRLIKGCIQLGSVRDFDRNMYFTPVDYVSKAIVDLSRRPESFGRAFHLINPQPIQWSEMINWIRAFGYPLQGYTFDEWRQILSDATRYSQHNALYPFVPMFFDERVAEMERANWFKNLVFSCEETEAALAEDGIACPPADAAMLETYFAFFIDSGFLEPPARGAAQQPCVGTEVKENEWGR